MIRKTKLFYKKYGEITLFIVGIVGLVFGLVQYFQQYTLKADMKYFLMEDTDVVSVNERIESLQIYFNDKNVVYQQICQKETDSCFFITIHLIL